MNIRVASFRMQQTPADVASNSLAARMYPGPKPAVFFGRRHASGISGLGDFSCPSGWTPCTNENGDNICLYPGVPCGNAAPETMGPVCTPFDTWAGQIQNPLGNCEQYYPGSGSDQQCLAFNGAMQIAQQQIQQAFGDCVPPDTNVHFDSSTGSWSVTQGTTLLFSGNIGAGNYAYGAAGSAGQNELQPQNIGLPGTMSAPSSSPTPTTPTPAPVSVSPQPVSQPIPTVPVPVTTVTPTTVTPAPVSTSPAASTAVSTAPTSSQSSSCSGVSLGGTCLDTTTLLIAGGLLVLLFAMRK